MYRKTAMRIGLVLGAIVVGWISAIGLPPSWVLSAQDRSNYELLLNAQYFASRAVGYSAVEPPEAHAFMSLATHRGGNTALRYLLLRGSPAGKIYALIGLRRTSPWFFWAAVQPFRICPGDVVTFLGCIISAEPIRRVVETDKPNPVRLRRGQTLRDWWQHRKPRTEANLDVIGGGYTGMFFEWNDLAQPVAQLGAPADAVPQPAASQAR